MTSEQLLNLFRNVYYIFIPPINFYTSPKQISGYVPVYNYSHCTDNDYLLQS